MTKANAAFTAPHADATEAGLSILKQGGSAIEAMVAAAAMIAVVYPHMNGIGGDGFWLIHRPNESPIAIDAAGFSASAVNDFPQKTRGGAVAITQAGTLAGWKLALAEDPHRALSLSTILAPAIEQARHGFIVTQTLADAAKKLCQEEGPNQAFYDLFAPNGEPLKVGSVFTNPHLAETFEEIANQGIDHFYQGSLAQDIIATLSAAGSPLTLADHAKTKAKKVTPLKVAIEGAELYNLPAPTQGISSLMILAIVDALKGQVESEAEWTHLIVEATKQSFMMRDQILADPAFMQDNYPSLLTSAMPKMIAQVNLSEAKPWPHVAETADTIWMGGTDQHGQMVSFIQSLYWEFGSGILIKNRGFVWNNRALGFSEDKQHPNAIGPNKKPKHTLNPALAIMDDGRRLIYGTMGGEGQPQTQAALFSRYFFRNHSLTDAIAKGRWLLGRTWGDNDNDLKLEADLADEIGSALTNKNHRWRTLPKHSELMGHAGAIATRKNIVIDLATDPRSDGAAEKIPC